MPNLLRSPRNSRIGRRIILLFLLCAIAPLLIAGGGMLLEFDDLLERKDRQDLDASVRNYGMSLMGRLVSADDVVLSLTRVAGVKDPDEWIVNQLGRYNWVHGVRRVRTDEDFASTDNVPPALSAQQRMAVALGGSALVVDRDAPLGVRLFLVHALPAGDLLYIEVDRAWAWGDLLEYTADSSLMLLDQNQRVLVAAGEQSGDSGDVQLHREVLAQLASRGGAGAADEGADAAAEPQEHGPGTDEARRAA